MYIGRNKHQEKDKERGKKDDTSLCFFGIEPSISLLFYTRAQIALWTMIMGYCSKVSIARIWLGEESRREQRRGDMFDKVFL